jgi:small-conductance mechanosensitive channel
MRTARFISLIIIFFSSFPLVAQDSLRPAPVIGLTVDLQGSPVVLLGDTLFRIRSSYGSFSPEERAHSLSARLMEVVREPEFYPDSLQSHVIDNSYYLIYRNRTLIVIQPNDTIGTGLSQEEILQRVTSILTENLAAKSVKFNLKATVKNIGYTAIILVALIFIIWLLNLVFRRIYRYAEKHEKKLFKSIRINNYEFLTAKREYEVAMGLLKFLKIVLIIFAFLVALPVIFTIFPSTEPVTRKIIGFIVSPLKNITMAVVNYLPKLVTIIVIFIIFKYLVKFIRFLANEVDRKALVLPGFYPEWAKPTYNIIRLILYAFMFVVIFPYLPGSDSAVFKGVSVFLGILLSLGSSSLISNIMAGLVVTYMRPYKVGDRIKIDDIIGTVMEKSLMITRIKTIKNEDVTIPNSKVLTAYSVNYTTHTEDDGLIIHTTVTIGYDAPWRTVHELLLSAAHATEGVVSKPKPFVLQTSLDDFYISYQVNAYIMDATNIPKIRSDLHQHIQDEFNRAGVEIMSPHYRAERDGNETTIPGGL